WRRFSNERRLIWLRHHAGIRLMDAAPENPEHPEPDFAGLPEAQTLPEFSPDHATPDLLRAAILRDGCMLIRGLVPRKRALRLGTKIDRAFDERLRQKQGQRYAEAYYEEFLPSPRFGGIVRG